MRRLFVASAIAGLLVVPAVAPIAAAGDRRPVGDSQVFAPVPDPGQPAGIAVHGNSVLVTTMGMTTQPTTDPRLFVFDRLTGELRRSIRIPRMMDATAMALAGVALDAMGRAYVVDMNGRILLIDPETGTQELYAEFPAMGGVATMPFDIAFDRDGVAYVTDQHLAAIWRIPVGGGAPELWFQDSRLASYLLGSGIRLDPTGQYLYFTVAASSANGGQGIIYRLPVGDPTPRRLEEIFRYPARTNPFGIAFGATGSLYVALFGAHQVSVLRPDGTEELRFPSADENSRRQVPYERPVSLAFDRHGSLLVTNSASFPIPNPARMVVFDAFVNDVGAPIVKPAIGGARSGREATTRTPGPASESPHTPTDSRGPANPPRSLAAGGSPDLASTASSLPEREAARDIALTQSEPSPRRHGGWARLIGFSVAVLAIAVVWRQIIVVGRFKEKAFRQRWQ